MPDPSATRYDPVTVTLHWSTAGLVAALWLIGQTADWLPDGPLNNAVWSTHVVLGLLLALVFVGRVAWRVGAGRHLPPADAGALNVLAKATHYALYGLLLVVVALGVANALVRGYDMYGLFHLPQVVVDRSLRRSINGWHGLGANILLGVALFHAAAALVHHYVFKDGVLRRMGRPASRA